MRDISDHGCVFPLAGNVPLPTILPDLLGDGDYLPGDGDYHGGYLPGD